MDDWHIVRLIWITGVDNVYIFTKQQAVDELKGTTITLTLDGVTLPTIQTPVTMLNTADQQRLGFPGPTFAFLTGSILSPTALSVGDHTAGVVANDPVRQVSDRVASPLGLAEAASDLGMSYSIYSHIHPTEE